MSLQVWLPLNGNLNNQGLTSINPTLLNNTSYTTGKLGQALYNSGDGQGVNLNGYMDILKTYANYSMAAWVYLDATATGHSASILSSGNWNTAAGQCCFGFYNYNSGYNVLLCPNTSSWSNGISLSNKIQLNTWYHVAISCDGIKTIGYINGNKVGEYNGGKICQSSETNNLYIGSATYYTGFSLKGKINDVRIYDHALSAKEVKELSKGLVLHYKLDGKDETTTNLQSNGRMSTGSCYNGATQKYGFGANTDIYYEDGNFQGRDCVKFRMGTAGQAAHPFTNIAYSPAVNGYKTISFDYYPTILDKLVFYSYNGNSPCTWNYNVDGIKASSSTATTNIVVPVKTNKWNHIELTLYNTGTVADGWNYFQIGSGNHTSTTTDYWLFSNVQIEVKDHATPFTLGTRTYTTEYDCSGYEYNGTVSGTLTNSSDTPRYNASTQINGGTTISKTGGLPFITLGSCSFWAKIETVGSSGWLPFNGQDGSHYFMATSAGTGNFYHQNAGSSTTIYEDGKIATKPSSNGVWHHYVITGIDLSTWTNFKINNYGGSWNSPAAKWSDVRVYSTILSADDIKELYHTSASIGNDGTVYTYELEEV